MAINPADAAFLFNPITAVPYLIYKGVQGASQAAQKPKPPSAPPAPKRPTVDDMPPPPPPNPGWFEGEQGGAVGLPPQLPTPPGNTQVGGMGGVLERIIQQQEKEAEAARKFYPQRSKIEF